MPVSDAVLEQRAEQAVSDYIRYHRADTASELDFYRAIPASRQAISRAARAHTADGGKHPHQRRIPCAALRAFGSRLARRRQALCAAESFDELHRMVQAVGELVPSIGPLAVYDTVLRIGARLGLLPSDVYLHRGARDGAAAVRVDRGRSTVAVSELPPPFALLAAHEIEDCLCIVKGLLCGEPSPRPTGCRCNGARRPPWPWRVD